jgi:hypothetical protein
MDSQQRLQQRLQQIELKRIRSIRLGIRRIVMDLKKKSIHTRSNRRPRQQRNKLRLPATDAISRRRLLDGMSAIEHNRRKLMHHRQRPVIDNQRVVPKTSSPLRKKHPLIPRRANLINRMVHIPRRNKLALFYVHSTPGLARRNKQIRLPAKESRYLQYIDMLRRYLAVPRLMNIRKNRKPSIFRKTPKNSRTFHKPRPTKALHAGTVSLVVASLEDIRNTKVSSNPLNLLRHKPHMALRLNNARASDQKKLARANMHRPDFKGMAHEQILSNCEQRLSDPQSALRAALACFYSWQQ